MAEDTYKRIAKAYQELGDKFIEGVPEGEEKSIEMLIEVEGMFLHAIDNLNLEEIKKVQAYDFLCGMLNTNSRRLEYSRLSDELLKVRGGYNDRT